MSIQILTFLLYFTLIFIVTLGYGLFVFSFLTKQKLVNSFNFGDTGILGFYFILILSYLLHFFVSLNYYVTGLIFLLGLFFFYFI